MGFLGSFFSSVASAISSAIGSIGSALGSFATGIGTFLGGVFSKIPSTLERVAEFAGNLLSKLGIFKPDEKPEDMGERALQAAEKGIRLENFKDFDAYMEKLRNFELDPDKAAQRSPTEKLVAGLGVGTAGIAHKFNGPIENYDALWLLPLARSDYFTPERVQSWITTGRFSADIFDYLEGRLSLKDSAALRERLAADDAQGGPDATKRIAEELSALREEFQAMKARLSEGKEGA